VAELPAKSEFHNRAHAVGSGCPICGGYAADPGFDAGVRRRIIKRGALTLRSEPLELWWNDRPVPLSPLEASLMEPLMRRGRISWGELEAQLRISVETRVTIMHRIRQKFRDVGGRDPLETLRAWGLRLRIEPDYNNSLAVWIGADESTEAHLHHGGAHPY
jgi:DNA-binding response OmpR family regulator